MHTKVTAIAAATTIAFVLAAGAPAMAEANGTTASMQKSDTSSMKTAAHVSGVRLLHVKDPKQTLANAAVDDSSGTAVGHVQSVETYKSGHARAVMVSLTDGNKTVAIPARDLRYDKSSNTIDARLTKSKIEALPAHT